MNDLLTYFTPYYLSISFSPVWLLPSQSQPPPLTALVLFGVGQRCAGSFVASWLAPIAEGAPLIRVIFDRFETFAKTIFVTFSPV